MSHRVYFIAEAGGGFVKVGTTADLPRRIRELQTGSAGELEVLASIPGSYRLEAQVHDALRPWLAGGEWFALTPAVRRFVSDCSTLGITAALAAIDRAKTRRAAREDYIRAINDRRAVARASCSQPILLITSEEQIEQILASVGVAGSVRRDMARAAWVALQFRLQPKAVRDAATERAERLVAGVLDHLEKIGPKVVQG